MLHGTHKSTPDLSNLIKFIEDAFNNFLWKDDSLIHTLQASKLWSDKDSIVIEVYG